MKHMVSIQELSATRNKYAASAINHIRGQPMTFIIANIHIQSQHAIESLYICIILTFAVKHVIQSTLISHIPHIQNDIFVSPRAPAAQGAALDPKPRGAHPHRHPHDHRHCRRGFR